MLSNLGTPRPLPPAKARKANSMQKMSSSPPPAYGSPFTYPARRQLRQDILGSPMANTFQMVGWDPVGDNEQPNGTAEDDVAWLNEKSREELKDMLLKADVLIKERENELGITSAVCKGLFQNNVALKSKHEELLSRIPTSPARSTSSPSNLDHHSLLPEDSANFTTSYSESHVDRIRTPSPNLYRRHARRVSIAAADVSLLSDQNAELLEKLEKLEKEATSADQAGRRELKRLEKEITFLREALEKTQARSDELEEKVQGAVASQAWRRKKEREAKFRAMRNLGRRPSNNDGDDQESKVQNFAPGGSTFGGPSETFSFFPTAESPGLNRRQTDNDNVDAQISSLKPHEHALISQLLVKVQELEETNAKILQQQSDTATQLSAVQRDTAHISRVYECLADPNSVELELADSGSWYEDEERGDKHEIDSNSSQAICFRSLKRSLANEMEALRGTCIIRPEFTSSGKTRKTVMGLFDVEVPIVEDQDGESQHSSEDARPSSISVLESPWSEGHNSSWSSGIGGIDVVPSTRLSPLHFFSPPSQILAELSPLGGRPTLEAELAGELNGTWADMQARNDEYHANDHLRKSSLYDLSQLSVPPSPSPTSRAVSRRDSDELDYDIMRNAISMRTNDGIEHTPRTSASLLMPANSLQLSVEPPTPERQRIRQLRAGQSSDPSLSPFPRSPRVTLMSEVLRSRSNRWVDRRFRHRSSERSLERAANAAFGRDEDDNIRYAVVPSGASSALAIPKRLMTAVDNMIGGFDSATGICASDVESEGSDDGRSAPATPRAHEARAPARRRSGGRGAYDSELDALTEPFGEYADIQLHAGTSPQKSSVDYEQQGVLLRVWLWVQFAIVVFVFLYAMARRGPTTVLADGDKHKKAVSRRR